MAIDTLESVQASDVIETKTLSDEDLASIHYVEGTCTMRWGTMRMPSPRRKPSVSISDNTDALLRLAMAQAGSGDTKTARGDHRQA